MAERGEARAIQEFNLRAKLPNRRFGRSIEIVSQELASEAGGNHQIFPASRFKFRVLASRADIPTLDPVKNKNPFCRTARSA